MKRSLWQKLGEMKLESQKARDNKPHNYEASQPWFIKGTQLTGEPSWKAEFWWRRYTFIAIYLHWDIPSFWSAFIELLSWQTGCSQHRIVAQENRAEDLWDSFLPWIFIQQLLPMCHVPKYHLWKQKSKQSGWSNCCGLWAIGINTQVLDSHVLPVSCHSQLSFSFPWSFLKMPPNPILQTHQFFSPKSGADLQSSFHRECVLSVKGDFYRPTPDLTSAESGWSPWQRRL